jgi:hypothetical protein
VINWDEPHDGYSEITSYTIELRQSDESTFTVSDSTCDGSDPTILAARECSVPIQSLFNAPFLLDWGSIVYARV